MRGDLVYSDILGTSSPGDSRHDIYPAAQTRGLGVTEF